MHLKNQKITFTTFTYLTRQMSTIQNETESSMHVAAFVEETLTSKEARPGSAELTGLRTPRRPLRHFVANMIIWNKKVIIHGKSHVLHKLAHQHRNGLTNRVTVEGSTGSRSRMSSSNEVYWSENENWMIKWQKQFQQVSRAIKDGMPGRWIYPRSGQKARCVCEGPKRGTCVGRRENLFSAWLDLDKEHFC